MVSSDHACPCCGTVGLSVFYETRNVPVNSCLLMPTQQEAVNYPRGDVVLGFCEVCGFISNIAFDPSKVNYSSIYEDQQSFSTTFNSFAQNLVARLIAKYNLHEKHILEIGCGKGDFLVLLCELGHNSGVGIDPAFVNGRVQTKAPDRLTFIRDFYSERYAKYDADLLCCRHTLEHIPNTAEFVNTVRRSIGNRLDTIVYFELPDTIRILRDLAFWDIYYEHCSYFSLGSLARLFRSCKFDVISLSKEFDDQYLLIEAKPTTQKKTEKAHVLEESVEQTAKYVKYFSAHCCNKLHQWKNLLQKIQNEKQRAVVWGSGSKCVAFLTTLCVKDEIEYIVDINPYRHGKFIPGVGKKIMPPEFLKKNKPDIIIVMNPVYRKEISEMLDTMEVDADVISV